MSVRPIRPIVGLATVLMLSCSAFAQTAPAPSPASVMSSTARSSLGAGYLKPSAVPDSLTMLPLPPAPASAAMARDDEAARAAVALRGSPRWVQATMDAELLSPKATGAMSCAAGFAIGQIETPAIQRLLRRVMTDLGMSGSVAKRRYMRPRPFMVNGQPSCTPDWEPVLRKDGSYPSGHSAVGYGWGLILAEIVPDRAAQLVARGRAYGDSRRICNVHWLSDVEEGRVTAAAMVARLHADRAFQKDMKAARAEAKRLAAKPPTAAGSTADCAREAVALAPTTETP